ncbi:MAG: tetratricopeptide repeat protein [Chitinispirillales bacterium]|jgi:tetratricopeptide (TPR) repeat protein|nr:tetratricopeptide repeat protein [Chitinispirillales bacterium]
MKKNITSSTLAIFVLIMINGIGCAGHNKSKPHDDDAYGSRAYGYFLDGNMPLAVETYKKGYISARKTDHGHGAARHLSNIGRVYYEMGSLDSAVLYHRRAYEEFRAIDDQGHASKAAAFLALCLATGGDGVQAREWLKTAASTADRRDSEHYLAVIHGLVDCRLGAKIADENAVNAALAFYKKAKDHRMLSTIYILKADNETAKGTYAAAAGYLDSALTAIEISQERYKRSRILLRLASIQFRAGDEGAGKRYYERAAYCAPKGAAVPPIEEVMARLAD